MLPVHLLNISENKGERVMRILFTGGGTAGHINPAIAMANFIKEREPESEIMFVGTESGMEKSLVPKQGYDIEYITIHGFERKLSKKNVKTVFEIFTGIRDAKKIIKKFKPEVVMGTGGYVTGPVLYAAHLLKIPTLVHESNAFPGVTVRILARCADIVAVSMREAIKFLPKCRRIEITGNPIRPSILKENQFSAKRKLGLSDRKTILIFGGSLGAERINSVVTDWISQIADEDKYEIIMSTGRNNQYEKVMKRFCDNGINIGKYENIRVQEYIYDMDLALNAADLIIARSGSSISEMTALGKPAVLIPSPNVAGDHQMHNARAFESSGGAIVIEDSKLCVENLSSAVENILGDDKRLAEMKKCSKSIGITDAADKIYDLLKELVNK